MQTNRGRNKTPEAIALNGRIAVMVTQSELEAIKRLANIQGVTYSAYVRALIVADLRDRGGLL